MFRFVLPVALLSLAATAGFILPAGAEPTLSRSAVYDGPDLQAQLPPCSPSLPEGGTCKRVLACIGEGGLFFDGQARGDGVGIILGRTSAGVQCSGHWSNADGTDIRGEGRARLKCTDGTRFHLVYDSRDNRDGTQIGVGKDTQGRMIRAWTGDDVLHFFEEPPHKPVLKCGSLVVPLREMANVH